MPARFRSRPCHAVANQCHAQQGRCSAALRHRLTVHLQSTPLPTDALPLAQQSFASPLLISAAPSPRAAGQRHYLTNPCCSARCPCDAGQSLAFASLSGPKLRLTIAMLRLSMPGPLNAYLRQRISMPLPANAMLSPAPDHALPLPL